MCHVNWTNLIVFFELKTMQIFVIFRSLTAIFLIWINRSIEWNETNLFVWKRKNFVKTKFKTI